MPFQIPAIHLHRHLQQQHLHDPPVFFVIMRVIHSSNEDNIRIPRHPSGTPDWDV